MSNMAYCRFQNIQGDLRDCYETMCDEDDLSAEEETARKRLVKTCQDIVEQADFMGLLDEEN